MTILHVESARCQINDAVDYWGIAPWNHYFTREFRPEAQPVAQPDNEKVIVSACEASPYNIQNNARLQDSFWIKSQPYSLLEMFTAKESELASRFVGGTVYQTFLSAFFYHRWHAPVSGTITKAYLVDGTYYSDADAEGEDPAALTTRKVTSPLSQHALLS